MIDGKLKLSKDRKSLLFYVDQNYSRSCGESRADWEKVAEIPLDRLPKILDVLVKGSDGTEVHL